MKVLLDTHVLLWAVGEPRRLSRKVRTLLEQPDHTVIVSAVTGWELATKVRIGKLPQAEELVRRYDEVLTTLQADELPITSRHAITAGLFESSHRDPFDRLLAAQSLLEGLPLISQDEVFRAFPVRVIW